MRHQSVVHEALPKRITAGCMLRAFWGSMLMVGMPPWQGRLCNQDNVSRSQSLTRTRWRTL